MENQSLDFYQRVRHGYLDLARREPQRVKIVDGNRALDAIEQDAWEKVRHVLQ
jgi:dTMP kinase